MVAAISRMILKRTPVSRRNIKTPPSSRGGNTLLQKNLGDITKVLLLCLALRHEKIYAGNLLFRLAWNRNSPSNLVILKALGCLLVGSSSALD